MTGAIKSTASVGGVATGVGLGLSALGLVWGGYTYFHPQSAVGASLEVVLIGEDGGALGGILYVEGGQYPSSAGGGMSVPRGIVEDAGKLIVAVRGVSAVERSAALPVRVVDGGGAPVLGLTLRAHDGQRFPLDGRGETDVPRELFGTIVEIEETGSGRERGRMRLEHRPDEPATLHINP